MNQLDGLNPAETTDKAQAKRVRGRLGNLALSLALVGATLVGGFGGGAAMRYWSDREPTAPASAAPSAPATAPVTNVALPNQAVTVAAVYATAGPAVVTISVTGQRSQGFFSQPVQGEGTGFIVDEQGDILTNYHVVEGARRVFVTTADGTRLSANVVGTDPGSDLAVIKADIPRGKLALARLGDSSTVVVGDPVVAIGTPFGLDQTVTAGIVSALNRTFGDAAGRPMRGLIQTDAPINPGNSGGPLLNMQGEVIGITASIESPVRASVGIGFAIPINNAKRLLPQLKQGGAVDHPWFGISGQAISLALADELRLPVNKGVLVAEAIAGGPAATAGIRGGSIATGNSQPANGDIITAVDGTAVSAVEDIAGYIDTKHIGDTVTVDILRDGKTQQFEVKLGTWPQSRSS